MVTIQYAGSSGPSPVPIISADVGPMVCAGAAAAAARNADDERAAQRRYRTDLAAANATLEEFTESSLGLPSVTVWNYERSVLPKVARVVNSGSSRVVALQDLITSPVLLSRILMVLVKTNVSQPK